MARPDNETRTAAKERIKQTKATRDAAHQAAEEAKKKADEAMWKSIASELDANNLLQADVAEVTEFSRDHVLRRTKQYRTQQDD
ncbi:hypothetical protein [Streptomyces sp. NPDC053720]|uniref:hypothetical protein n=1 Tax=Streptomyces sp. NPDC053720 TaxID=3154855 RepID=UPI00342944DB